MTARLDRLKKRADFLRVAALRRKWAAPGLILQAAPATGPQADSVRVGFTVSKKVGNAVARNRAKRRLRAAVDAVFPCQAALGLDYVVIGRRETIDRPYSLLLQDLRAALKRVGGVRALAQAPSETARGEA
ncbi:ribonuclease P protein component [Magnetospirillum sp. SS-4]|uniref:ribonuclease P protein component n=1 Tax=Magnetospirillum sp. SS-4 TaxID=2681465 RepID=UPI001382964A|nr:ribonuclease P protein component [Magnetospirillum sp. SS-4]CAA7612229.1 Ribonuclease P protein component [Magnetospirillum sp. SS-4]